MTDVKVTRVTDHPDGTCTVEMEMDEHVLFFLARVGMMHLIETEANRVLDGYPNTEGDGNAEARAGRDSELFGEIPGL